MEDINKMELSELQKYATELIKENEELKQSVINKEQLQINCESAYAKIRALTNELDTVKTEYNTKLTFAQQAVSTCYSSIIFANKS